MLWYCIYRCNSSYRSFGVGFVGFVVIEFIVLKGVVVGVWDVVLLFDAVNDIVRDSLSGSEYKFLYASFKFRISYWLITCLFLENSCFINLRTVWTLKGSSTILGASLRQSLNISSTDRFSMSWEGFILLMDYYGLIKIKAFGHMMA